jgi:hypothetical protein
MSYRLSDMVITNMQSNGYARGLRPICLLCTMDNPADDSLAQGMRFLCITTRMGLKPCRSCGDVNADGFGDLAAIYTGVGSANTTYLPWLGWIAQLCRRPCTRPSSLCLLALSRHSTPSSQAIDITVSSRYSQAYILQTNLYSMRGEHDRNCV